MTRVRKVEVEVELIGGTHKPQRLTVEVSALLKGERFMAAVTKAVENSLAGKFDWWSRWNLISVTDKKVGRR